MFSLSFIWALKVNRRACLKYQIKFLRWLIAVKEEIELDHCVKSWSFNVKSFALDLEVCLKCVNRKQRYFRDPTQLKYKTKNYIFETDQKFFSNCSY